jgi:hypothetical protein
VHDGAKTGEADAVLAVLDPAEKLSEDVMNERRRAYNIIPGPEHPIVVRDLRKVFPGRGGAKEHIAVQNMSLAVAQGECFGYAIPSQHTVASLNIVPLGSEFRWPSTLEISDQSFMFLSQMIVPSFPLFSKATVL